MWRWTLKKTKKQNNLNNFTRKKNAALWIITLVAIIMTHEQKKPITREKSMVGGGQKNNWVFGPQCC
jgi:hypothetical protein